ncbi:Ste24 endopeptidase [hydrothermal vent metagenome]|uniref:Ste24 endopeptidase n=1 Tax=hydrothermal vent metagenome TaxID=652676 RepID=A0A3B1DWS8_9ZZZZ
MILTPSKYKIAADYSVDVQKLNMLTIFYDFVLFFFWIGFGLGVLNELTLSFQGWQKAIVFIDLFIISNWILSLPFSLYTTFKLDKEYDFSNMTPSLYIKDTVKSGLLFLIFGSAIIAGLSLIIEYFPSWWIWGFAFIFSIIITINMLAPYFMMLFNKFEPLQDLELQEKIENLLDHVGFKSSGVFSSDASKRDNRLNAYFGGLGSSKRVVLFDTLIKKLSHDELLAVLGHELGHAKNGDIYKNIGIMGIVIFVFFAIFGNLPEELFLSLHLNKEPFAIILTFLIFSPILSFFLMPLISALSRHNEYEADEFGSNLSSKNDLINALLKLANENKSFPLSHPLYIFFFYSHPPLLQRLEKLGYKK